MFDTPEFQALRREYLQNVLERCEHLKEAVGHLRNGSETDLKRLRDDVHKFRGSGGFYGFTQLSAAAAETEDHLLAVMGGNAAHDSERIVSLIELVLTAAAKAAEEAGL